MQTWNSWWDENYTSDRISVAYDVIEGAWRILLGEPGAVENRSQNVRSSHSQEVPEDHGENEVVEPFQHVQMSKDDDGVASNDGKGHGSHGSVLGLSTMKWANHAYLKVGVAITLTFSTLMAMTAVR